MQAEARVLKGSLDSLGQERDKLGRDLQVLLMEAVVQCYSPALQVANARAELLVQEVDEQHGRQEKETRDQLQVNKGPWIPRLCKSWVWLCVLPRWLRHCRNLLGLELVAAVAAVQWQQGGAVSPSTRPWRCAGPST